MFTGEKSGVYKTALYSMLEAANVNSKHPFIYPAYGAPFA